ncbi:Rap1a/Tai family immunity protein [Pseudoduganella chitinolytica]|uniref:Rap1a/Tai family immunity protein n=1 Tax=Pseudoduganella chitinolytica TaxID=34070 RepID=A0ABY8BHR2_9BURK|nr:Rap1a/Tai family immunity protein [Pseudoduganella chitinolytica]WEF34893.1 Rap1a/Tai family immunity protein [Pseudoduganella chitinolytica]
MPNSLKNMPRPQSLIYGVLACLFSMQCQAQIVTGNQLQQWVAGHDRADAPGATPSDLLLSRSAMHYITGVAESYDNARVVCLTDGVTVGQLVAVVAKHLKQYPEDWNNSANLLVLTALNNAFPCKKK